MTCFLLVGLAILATPWTVLADVDVQVGPDNTLRFSPETIQATIGESVIFHFHSDTHSATESTARLKDPCNAEGGFDTGVQDDGAVQSIKITTTNSIYVHCSPHCSKGMVMIVNPGPNDSVEAFRAAAVGQAGGSAPASAPAPPSSSGSRPAQVTPTQPKSPVASATAPSNASSSVPSSSLLVPTDVLPTSFSIPSPSASNSSSSPSPTPAAASHTTSSSLSMLFVTLALAAFLNAAMMMG